jgi:hypothetical protein
MLFLYKFKILEIKLIFDKFNSHFSAKKTRKILTGADPGYGNWKFLLILKLNGYIHLPQNYVVNKKILLDIAVIEHIAY